MCLSHLVLCHSLLSHFSPKHQQQEESKGKEEAQPAEGKQQEQRALGWAGPHPSSSDVCSWWEKCSGNTAFLRVRQWQERERCWYPNPSRILGKQQYCTKLRTEPVFQSGLLPECVCACVCVRAHVHMCTTVLFERAVFWQSQQQLIANKLLFYSAPKPAAFNAVPVGNKSITGYCYMTQ